MVLFCKHMRNRTWDMTRLNEPWPKTSSAHPPMTLVAIYPAYTDMKLILVYEATAVKSEWMQALAQQLLSIPVFRSISWMDWEKVWNEDRALQRNILERMQEWRNLCRWHNTQTVERWEIWCQVRYNDKYETNDAGSHYGYGQVGRGI